MTNFKAGDLVLVKFPFANLTQAKKRPALVLFSTPVNRKDSLVTIAMVTSKLEGLDLEGDVILKDWEKAHLLHPSLIRLSKIATLDSGLIEKRIGTLSEADRNPARKQLRASMKEWL